MTSIFNFKDYKDAIEVGEIPNTYKNLMLYMMLLRNNFKKNHPKELTIGRFYQGYMDMSYFSLTNQVLKKEKLKIGLVFNHEIIQFELWLVGQNKQSQKEFWNKLKITNSFKYNLSYNGDDYIFKLPILKGLNLDNLNRYSNQIEQETMEFLTDISNDIISSYSTE